MMMMMMMCCSLRLFLPEVILFVNVRVRAITVTLYIYIQNNKHSSHNTICLLSNQIHNIRLSTHVIFRVYRMANYRLLSDVV